jgi:hypothetical protein
MNTLEKNKSLYEDYPDYMEREEAKREGWDIIGNKDATPYQKAHAYLYRIIWSHYWRARESMESQRRHKSNLKKVMGNSYYPGYRLDIDHYTNHWLYANGNRISNEVLKIIAEEYFYEPKKNKYLPEGMTLYQCNGI